MYCSSPLKNPTYLCGSAKLPRFMGGSMGPRMEICENSGLPIPIVPRCNGYIKRKLRVCRAQKCTSLVGAETVLPSAGPQTIPFHGGQYRDGNGNMRNFRAINPHGTVFALKQWLYQKDATSIESSKMYRPNRCRDSNSQCRAANYPVSRGEVYGREWKYSKTRAYPSAWYHVSTRGVFISNRSYRDGEPKNVLLKSVEKPHLPVRDRKLSRFMGGSIGMGMEICETSGLPIPMVPRLHQSNGYIKGSYRYGELKNI